MFITALCPTYRRQTLKSSIACWEQQDYDPAKRHLIILDDGGDYAPQFGKSWTLYSISSRFVSLPLKYECLLHLDAGWADKTTDVYLPWEDDDLYLPHYISSHVECLKKSELSKSYRVLTDYEHGSFPNHSGRVESESAIGRFYNLALRRSLVERLIETYGSFFPRTNRADFDQEFIQRLHKHAISEGDPWDQLYDINLPYVYCWHTGEPHAQCSMQGGDDLEWYDRWPKLIPKPTFTEVVKPELSEVAKRIVGYINQQKVSSRNTPEK